MSSDREAIAEVVRDLYAAVSFERGGSIDFDRLELLFIPGARLAHVKREGTELMDNVEFSARAMRLIERGELHSFYERELAHRIDVFGHMAHVLSTYEAFRAPDDETLLARGVNSIQLLKDVAGWRVISIVWQDEDAGERIPDDLPARDP